MNKQTLEAAAGVYSGTAHDPNTKPHPMHIERNKAFKAGAEWQQNHVWHQANEEIADGEYLTLITTSEGRNIAEVAPWRNGKYQGAYNIQIYLGKASVHLCARINDLLPTSFGEIIEANNDVPKRLEGGDE